jgi:hypothetical protein
VFIIEMRASDAVIIYLAIGSPFAVHYFLQLSRSRSQNHILRAISTFLFWPVYAVRLTGRVTVSKDGRTISSSDDQQLDARFEKKVGEIQAALEIFVGDLLPERPILDCRDILERYIGLTLALRTNPDRSSQFAEIIPGSDENINLNSVCMNRRNRKRLENHQNRARRDFLTLVSEVIDIDGRHSAFGASALELTRVISDTDAFDAIVQMQEQSEQSQIEYSVTSVERDVWHPQKPKQSAASRI